jgi:Amt family ammonium transporter
MFSILRRLFATLSAAALLATPTMAQTSTNATPAPTPTVEQRLAGIEAYLQNTDPALALQAADGHIPAGLTMASLGVAGPGHNAWMMLSAALVLFMTLPGLAIFYGGLVRRKNVLSLLAQCLGVTALVTALWWAVGYSLAFSRGTAFLGGFDYLFFKGVDARPNADYSPWVSNNIFAMFQMMFAIITPALIIGAVAERIRFVAILSILGAWVFVVYFPIAHMAWGIDGLMNGVWNPKALVRAIDFAGGTVVEMASGWSALTLCLIVGRRHGFGREHFAPHSMVLCMVGTGILWVGWYGFNAGSALAADGIAANAFVTTTLAGAAAAGTWALMEYFAHGKASVLGFCSGAVAGLVAITPACGFVNPTGAMVVGLLGGIIPYFAVMKLKAWLGYDDALDVFGVHGVAGTLGLFLTGLLADPAVNPNLLGKAAQANGLAQLVGHGLWLEQLKAIGITFTLSVAGTALIAFVVKAVMAIRPSPEQEHAGLDLSEHGEEGYLF